MVEQLILHLARSLSRVYVTSWGKPRNKRGYALQLGAMWKGHCLYVFVAVVGGLALQKAVSGAGEASSTAEGTRTSGLRNGDGGSSGQTERLPAPKPPPPPTSAPPQRTEGEQIADFPPRSWSARPGMSAGKDPGDLQSEPRDGGDGGAEEGQCLADDQVFTACWSVVRESCVFTQNP